MGDRAERRGKSRIGGEGEVRMGKSHARGRAAGRAQDPLLVREWA